MRIPRRWRRPWSLAFLSAAAALIAFVLLAEVSLRLWTPQVLQSFAQERPGRFDPRAGRIELDRELGYRPVLGGPEYGPQGALWNEYALEKPPGVRRLLFLGDSVTYRGKIIAGLRALLGEEGLEYWNAGVAGYSTGQELDYYRLICAGIRADRVILTFHLNDYQTTPITFMDGDRVIMMHTKDCSRALIPALWRSSYLYRLWRSLASHPAAAPDIQREIQDDLRELRDLVHERGAELTVLVLPWLRPVEQWHPSMPHKHERLLRELSALGIEHYEFLVPLEAALAEGVQVTQGPRDYQHPSDEFGARMAREMRARGFVP